MPTQEVLDAYYSQYYEHDNEEQVTFEDVSRFSRHILSFVTLDAGARVLDFGGGDGGLVIDLASRLGFDVEATLVDYAEARQHDIGTLTLTRVADLANVEGTFQLVIASAILEHIPTFREAITTLFDRIEPGGFFYARTPYMLPLARLLGNNIDMCFPGHVHDLGPEFWNRAIETFSLDAEMLRSGPSIVETSFRESVGRTLAAHVMKAPSRLEVRLRGLPTKPIWPFVGGWEVVLQKRNQAA